jgi:hypothetical protein
MLGARDQTVSNRETSPARCTIVEICGESAEAMVAEASGLLEQSRRGARGTSVALVHSKGPAFETHHLVVSLGSRCAQHPDVMKRRGWNACCHPAPLTEQHVF